MNKWLFSLIATCFITTFCHIDRPIKNPETKQTAGVHILAEFWGARIIEDTQELEQMLIEAAEKAGCTSVQTISKKFEPQGVTGMILLTESHLTIHTWPELDYIAIDFFACGDNALPLKGIAHLEQQLKPRKAQIKEVARGEITTAPAPLTKKPDELFGQELTIDLKNCDHETICSEEKLREFIDQLCILIDMKKFGEPFIERFALHSEIAAGYSCAQMIKTSLISGHFSEYIDNAYINIFSCKNFDAEVAVEFTKDFFGAEHLNYCNTLR